MLIENIAELSSSSTKPGFIINALSYSLTFSEVIFDGRRSSMFTRGFENCYDWTDIMKILLKALNNFENVEKAEDFAEQGLGSWFMTYRGWSLLSMLLPIHQQFEFTRKINQIKQDLDYKDCTDDEHWDKLLENENILEMIPEFYVTLREGELGENKERKKQFQVRFVMDWNLDAVFTVERRKKSSDTLVNCTTKALAQVIGNINYVDFLEIPNTMKTEIKNDIMDLNWISPY